MGRSKAQDALEERIRELFPDAFVVGEEYIGDLIEERGYSADEIASELGHKPHKMFVDIVLRDSDRTVAFEYHGEQHYSLVGNMTRTTADLLANQLLDQEKSWILSRIGIPIVAVPYDMYVDARVIEELIDEASAECMSHRARLSECSGCGRLFPSDAMPYGVCGRCREEEPGGTEAGSAESPRERRRRLARERKAERAARAAEEGPAGDGDGEADEAAIRKAEARSRRREAYREYKESDLYRQRREEARRARKEAYKKAKEQRKRNRG